MSNSIAPGSSADVNVRVTALTTNPNVPAQYKTIILKKNLVNGVNTLTQAMMSAQNTKYVIKYDYVLGENITVPSGCILEFDGGSISGDGTNKDTITGTNTGIVASLVKIFNTNITLAGTWNVAEAYPEWFGAVGDGVTDDGPALQKTIDYFYSIFLAPKTYNIASFCHYHQGDRDWDYPDQYIYKNQNFGLYLFANKNVIIRGASIEKTKIKCSCPSNLDYFIRVGSNIGGCSISELRIEGNGVGVGLSFAGYGKASGAYHKAERLIITDFEVGYLINEYQSTVISCNASNCGTGFKAAVENSPLTPNAKFPGISIISCSTEGCNIGFHIENVSYSTFNGLGVGNSDIAYFIKNSREINLLGCGAEYSQICAKFIGSTRINWLGGTFETKRITQDGYGNEIAHIISESSSLIYIQHIEFAYKTGSEPEYYIKLNTVNTEKNNITVEDCSGCDYTKIYNAGFPSTYINALLIKGKVTELPNISNAVGMFFKIEGSHISCIEIFDGTRWTDLYGYTKARKAGSEIAKTNYVTPSLAGDNDAGFEFYNYTTIMPEWWNGNSWKAADGNPAGLKRSGTSSEKPYGSIKPGTVYFNTDNNKPAFFTGADWNEADGAYINVKRSGTFAQKPTSSKIYVGFAYFCTDKQTTEGATDGIMIYHKGSDVWVDAFGRVVS